jgi:lipoyl(octanoyl) transferase
VDKVYTIKIINIFVYNYEIKLLATLMPQNWRLILTSPSTGAKNMALDESLLISTALKNKPSTLRLYSWDVPTLSLGYAQSIKDVDLTSLERLGWGLVRRPTGGRAILHTDELTYSVTASIDDPIMSGSLLESYQRISKALLTALSILGIHAHADSVYPTRVTADGKDPVCFEVPSNYEITVIGKKLIGSAQARKNNGVLQHGSLPLFGDLTRITRVLNYENEEKKNRSQSALLAHAGTISSLTGLQISIEQAQKAFIEGFSKSLDISFAISEPSRDELEITEELEKTKYGSPLWTHRI